MTRTVTVTKGKYLTKTENGLIETTFEQANFDEDKFVRNLKKQGIKAIVTETEEKKVTYELADEIFFKYATVKEEPTTETEQAQ